MNRLKELSNTHEQLLTSRKQPLHDDGIRSPYERDIHRIMYCDAFRRLRHKTQVYFLVGNDHICTRLEHVLHVAEAATTVARQLELDVDLTRAIALGHDLGHAPFGHFGEEVLSEIAKERGINGHRFHHEVHGLRVVDKLAQLDREECGLHLTYAVRDGIISHCGEDPATDCVPSDPTRKVLEEIVDRREAGNPVTPEGCIVRIADKIAYAGRDLEDALKVNLISEGQLKDELAHVEELLGNNNGEIVGRLVTDLIRNGCSGRIALTQNVADALRELIAWNYQNIYKQPKVERYKKHARLGIRHLFEQFLGDIESTRRFRENLNTLPTANVYDEFRRFVRVVNYDDETASAQIVLDFIAGMTDNYLTSCVTDLFVPQAIA